METCNCTPYNPIGHYSVYLTKRFEVRELGSGVKVIIEIYYCDECKTYFMTQEKDGE